MRCTLGVQAMIHLLKLLIWRDDLGVNRWRGKVLVFLHSAHRRYAPSMNQHLDLNETFQVSHRHVELITRDRGGTDRLPPSNVLSPDDLLVPGADVDELVAKLATGAFLCL